MLHSKRLWTTVSLLLLMVLVLSACAGYSTVKPPEPTSTPLPPAPTEPPVTATAPIPTPTPIPPTATPASPTETPEPATEAPTAGTNTGGDAEAGAQMYASNCAACHGQEGEGGIASPLAGLNMGAEGIDIVIRYGKTGDVGIMPPFGQRLSEQDIQNLVAFVLSLGN